jgi:hypothetical protein
VCGEREGEEIRSKKEKTTFPHDVDKGGLGVKLKLIYKY